MVQDEQSPECEHHPHQDREKAYRRLGLVKKEAYSPVSLTQNAPVFASDERYGRFQEPLGV